MQVKGQSCSGTGLGIRRIIRFPHGNGGDDG